MADIAGPSNPNPNPNPEKIFQFTITPLTQFKPALEALIDRHFNPIGLGVMDVKDYGVDFTAQNVDTKATGILTLNSGALKGFQFNTRFKDKLMRINFREIVLNISDNDESITFVLFEGSNNIIFQLGNDPFKMFYLELLDMPPEFERFVFFTSVCAALIPSNMLREMVDRLKSQLSLGINELVSASVSQTLASVFIGDINQPQWSQNYDNRRTGTIGLGPGQIHHAWFIWPHLEVLRKASLLSPFFVLRFVIQPREMILTQISLQELGSLRIVSRATKILRNVDQIPPDVAVAAAASAVLAAAAQEPIL